MTVVMFERGIGKEGVRQRQVVGLDWCLEWFFTQCLDQDRAVTWRGLKSIIPILSLDRGSVL